MNERLKQFIEYLGISTRNFEQKISVSNGLIGRFLSKNTTIQSDVLSKICYTYPELNPSWLIIGRGEMLLNNHQEEISTINNSNNVSRLITILQATLLEKDKQIDRLLSIIEQGKV